MPTCKFTSLDIDNIAYSCNVAFGGVAGIKLQPLAGGSAIEIEFNPSDAVTTGSETKTLGADGTVGVEQSLIVEIPKITKERIKYIKGIASPNMEFKIFVLTKSGAMITLGNTFGAYVQTVDLSSGTGRKDKNRVQLTFMGDEVELAPVVDAGKVAYDAITVKADPVSFAAPLTAKSK